MHTRTLLANPPPQLHDVVIYINDLHDVLIQGSQLPGFADLSSSGQGGDLQLEGVAGPRPGGRHKLSLGQ